MCKGVKYMIWFFRFQRKSGFFLYEKESLLRDNDVSFKAGWMLAYKQD